jgi:hypothetical protein
VKRRGFDLGLLIDTILQCLAGLKHGSLCRSDFNLIAGAGIARQASRTVANFKRPEAHNLDFIAGAKASVSVSTKAFSAFSESFLIKPVLVSIALINSPLY